MSLRGKYCLRLHHPHQVPSMQLYKVKRLESVLIVVKWGVLCVIVVLLASLVMEKEEMVIEVEQEVEEVMQVEVTEVEAMSIEVITKLMWSLLNRVLMDLQMLMLSTLFIPPQERQTWKKVRIGVRRDGLWYLDRKETSEDVCLALMDSISEEEAKAA